MSDTGRAYWRRFDSMMAATMTADEIIQAVGRAVRDAERDGRTPKFVVLEPSLAKILSDAQRALPGQNIGIVWGIPVRVGKEGDGIALTVEESGFVPKGPLGNYEYTGTDGRRRYDLSKRRLPYRQQQLVRRTLVYLGERIDEANADDRRVLQILVSPRMVKLFREADAIQSVTKVKRERIEGCVGQMFGYPVVESPMFGSAGYYDQGVEVDIKTEPLVEQDEAEWRGVAARRAAAFRQAIRVMDEPVVPPTRTDPLGQGIDRPADLWDNPPMTSLPTSVQWLVQAIEQQMTALARVGIESSVVRLTELQLELLRGYVPGRMGGNLYLGMQIRIDGRVGVPQVEGPLGERALTEGDVPSGTRKRVVWTDV